MKKFPEWLSRNDAGVFVIDRDKAYPAIMEALGLEYDDLDQYWVEVIFQCAKMAVQEFVEGTELDPRPADSLRIAIEGSDDSKVDWALANHKPGVPGRDTTAASKGLHAKRDHWPRIRHAILAAA